MSRIVVPRRSVLQGLGATAALGCGPGGGTAGDPLAAGEIDTIVLVMMENRTFDHTFGSLSLLEGHPDVDGLTAQLSNPDPTGAPVAPVVDHMRCVHPDPPHSWKRSRIQHADGTNQGFVEAFLDDNPGADPTIPMLYQTRDQQPISYALADEYALCDRWFASVLSSTWPNRIYLHAAQNQGIEGNDLPPGASSYTCRTLWDQLDEAGIDWGYYYTDLPTLALFGRADWADRLATVEQFYADARSGSLPRVVGVAPGAGFNDDHPPYHPLLGQLFIGSIYTALATSPHWDRCLFVLCYDEGGGFYDHVPPPTTEDDYAELGFDQLGFRVPGLVMGPYARNMVSHTQFEHTAPLTFIQDTFGIDERLTLRNEVSNSLAEVLDHDRLARGEPRPPIVLPDITRSEADIEAECEALGRRSGQPELRQLVAERMPHLDRTAELPDIARRFWQTVGEQGLWVPT